MTKLTLRKCCPSCGSRTLERMRPAWWMKLIPRSRYYCCYRCECFFLVL